MYTLYTCTYLTQLIFLRKEALGVQCYFALFTYMYICLILLAFFFLPSRLSLKHVHVHACTATDDVGL